MLRCVGKYTDTHNMAYQIDKTILLFAEKLTAV